MGSKKDKKKEKKDKKKDKRKEKAAEASPQSSPPPEVDSAEMNRLLKRQRKEEKQRAKDNAVLAEKMALERQLFGTVMSGRSSGGVGNAARTSSCPMRPEVGLQKMADDEMAARALTGKCNGGLMSGTTL